MEPQRALGRLLRIGGQHHASVADGKKLCCEIIECCVVFFVFFKDCLNKRSHLLPLQAENIYNDEDPEGAAECEVHR